MAWTGEAVQVRDGEGEEVRDFLRRIHDGDEDAARELLSRYEAEVRLVVRRQLPKLLRSRFDSLDFLQSVWGSFFHRVRTTPTEFDDGRHLVGVPGLGRQEQGDRPVPPRREPEGRHAPRGAALGRRRSAQGGRRGRSRRPARSPRRTRRSSSSATSCPRSVGPLLELKADGLSSREIGQRLGISERTVQRVLEDLRRRVATEG